MSVVLEPAAALKLGQMVELLDRNQSDLQTASKYYKE